MKQIRRIFAAALIVCLSLPVSAGAVAIPATVPRLPSVIAKAPKPRYIDIVNPVKRMAIGQSVELKYKLRPVLANQNVMWYTSNTVASVTEDGLLTANRVGRVKITVRAKAKLSVKDYFALEVYDPSMPTKVTVTPDMAALYPGETAQMKVVCEPAGADDAVDWYSSDTSCAVIDENGVVSVVSYGQSVITAVAKNGGAKGTALVVVLKDYLYDAVPERTTFRDVSAVNDNIELIDGIYSCAAGEVAKLYTSGKITASERGKRIKILTNAFDMYRFAWYTDVRVRYWTSAYGGAKDFYPGKVYFGMPYIQSGRSGSRVNRRFNVAKAVSGAYYSYRGDQLYRMTNKRLDGSYVGNDCSAFVGMSTFVGNGYSVGNGVCFMLTSSIVSSSMYRPVASFDDLRPGDIIVRGHDHAIMFLYYTDSAKTRMMIIEQGGGSNIDMHNTVCCSVVNRSKYESKYVIRRARFLAA